VSVTRCWAVPSARGWHRQVAGGMEHRALGYRVRREVQRSRRTRHLVYVMVRREKIPRYSDSLAPFWRVSWTLAFARAFAASASLPAASS
jgi:hypothetical protein